MIADGDENNVLSKCAVSELAYSFVRVLQDEHSYILAQLLKLRSRPRGLLQLERMQRVCGLIKTHFAAEHSVFYPAINLTPSMTAATTASRQEFRKALTLIRDLQVIDPADCAHAIQLAELCALFRQHVWQCDGPQGVHTRASLLPLNWTQLTVRYERRCVELFKTTSVLVKLPKRSSPREDEACMR